MVNWHPYAGCDTPSTTRDHQSRLISFNATHEMYGPSQLRLLPGVITASNGLDLQSFLVSVMLYRGGHDRGLPVLKHDCTLNGTMITMKSMMNATGSE